jgi:hypothetical protein
MTLTEKLRALSVMIEELKASTDDRFSDLGELGAAVARLSKGKDSTVSRLGAIGEYLAQDGASEVLSKIGEISDRVDSLIKQAKGHQ